MASRTLTPSSTGKSRQAGRFLIRLTEDSARGFPEIETLGTGPDMNLECQDGRGGRLIILGVCLLGAAEVAARFSAAMRSARPELIAEYPGA